MTVTSKIERGITLLTAQMTKAAAVRALCDAITTAIKAAEVSAIVLKLTGHSVEDDADFEGLIDLIEGSPKPVAAVWSGRAQGLVFEIGLAAHWRLVIVGAEMGLANIKLGLTPCAGATQRLPRLIGMSAALDLICSGRSIGAQEAISIGLADRQIDAGPDLDREVIETARALTQQTLRRTSTISVDLGEAGKAKTVAESLIKRARSSDAVVAATRLCLLSAQSNLTDGMREEKKTFLNLKNGSQSAALRYVAYAEKEVGNRPDIPLSKARPVQKVGVIGVGTMGAGIAVSCLDSEYDVTIIETRQDHLQIGRERIEAIYSRSVANKLITQDAKDACLSRLSFSTNLDSLREVDLIIEAVFEDFKVKSALLKDLEARLDPKCIFATNTSYLDINLLGKSLKDPSRLIGLHFFSPAHVMKLLEIVRADESAADVLATAFAVSQKLNKIAVVAGVCDGFIGNRILTRYRAQCEFMLEEGALPYEIDQALEAYGFAMGPFAVSDLAGLDISWARRKSLARTRNPPERYVPLADIICKMGRFGRKTGAGWYRYQDGKKQRDPEIEALVKAHAKASGWPQKSFTADEIVTRVLVTMANEGCKLIQESIAARPLDIDVVLLNGYGFPPFRGGPMFAADQLGWATVIEKMQTIEARDGAPFTISQLAKKLAIQSEDIARLNASMSDPQGL